MLLGGKKATFLLFIGDIGVFALSLWLTLVVRYQALPTQELWALHVGPFAFLFALWALIFYMAGLYGKQVVRLRVELWGAIIRTQLLNITLAGLFFFLSPQIAIAPKTNLAIYLLISLVGICIWRLALFPKLTAPSWRERAALVAEGPECNELEREVNGSARYPLRFALRRAPKDLNNFAAFAQELEQERIRILVIDTEHEAVRAVLPQLYEVAFGARKIDFVDFYDVYEEVFDRVPLSLLRYDWFFKNISLNARGLYRLIKRSIDIIGGCVMGAVTAILAPFLYIAMRIEGKGPLFIVQERLGEGGTPMKAYKFRSMEYNDSAARVWVGEGSNRVTRVGAFLRKTSLDEFPQFVNVLRGELSLIGPRNDIMGLGERLAEEIPYYRVRYAVKPGITGWAQINQRYEPGNISPQSLEETKMRLAYDFYYIEHRSLSLDLVIALKTLKRMIFRVSDW